MPALTEADRTRLHDIIEREWIEVALARDYDACLAFFSDDFVYMPHDQPAIRNKKGLRDFLEAFPQVKHFTQTLEAAHGGPDLAAVHASVDFTMEGDDRDLSGTGKFLATMAKRGDEWLFTALCYNFDAPLGATT